MNEFPVEVVIKLEDGSESRVQLGTAWQHGDEWAVWLDPRLVDRPSRGLGRGSDPRLADLEYLAARARKTLDDPRRQKWHDEAREQLIQIEAEIDRVAARAH